MADAKFKKKNIKLPYSWTYTINNDRRPRSVPWLRELAQKRLTFIALRSNGS